MDKRFVAFILLASGVLFLNAFIVQWLDPPKPRPAAQQGAEKKPAGKPQAKPEPGAQDLVPGVGHVQAPAVDNVPAEPLRNPQAENPEEIVALGSVNPGDGFSALYTFSTRGAALLTCELAGEEYRDTEDPTGYLGHLNTIANPDTTFPGLLVRSVGKGTPADAAGLKVGDLLTAFNDTPLKQPGDLRAALKSTRPGQQHKLSISRKGQPAEALSVTLARHPLEIVRLEGNDPPSLLMTLHKLDGQTIPIGTGFEVGVPKDDVSGAQINTIEPESPAAKAGLKVGDVIVGVDAQEVEDSEDLNRILLNLPSGTRIVVKVERDEETLALPLSLPAELPGLNLRGENWKRIAGQNPLELTFRYEVPGKLEILKRFKLDPAKAGAASQDYHLSMQVELKNLDDRPHELAYQLDGPTGLPIEGWWYGNKIGRDWGAIGVRDVAVQYVGNAPQLIAATELTGEKEFPDWVNDQPLKYIGIDAQYFSVALLPQQKGTEVWFAETRPLRVGPVEKLKERQRLTNTSCRVISRTVTLPPQGKPLTHDFLLFAGPKRPELLARYGLDDLVYYGWPTWAVVAKVMIGILHFFYSITGNYGLAIIMLTVLVRGCMFPLSRKQAQSAAKMQELQPEMKKIAEKYKNDMQKANLARQELWKKHNVKPLGGCMLMFIQLPIFLGLYRSLMIDVQLRQASLIPGMEWCSNLAAPDMLYRWAGWLPGFLSAEAGNFFLFLPTLGPYFNLLPCITIGLFLWQQKMFLPPPTDEQTAMQQKLMKYMMVLMGFMFFKVASGLCLYFIASSLWGIAERKLLPKPVPVGGTATSSAAAIERSLTTSSSNGNGSPARARNKQRGGK